MGIGTLNEGPLHMALKALYARPNAKQEVAVGSYVADVQGTDNVLYEIQTGGFGNIRRKLETLIQDYQVVLVYPVAVVRTIVKLPVEPDELASRRKSPKKGSLINILDELVSIPHLMNHDNFEVEVVLIEEDEIREYAPKKVRRRGGWRVVQRQLTSVVQRTRISNSRDLLQLLSGDLPDVFTTADLAVAMSAPRSMAQKFAYCLRASGDFVICGKQGNALCYELALP